MALRREVDRLQNDRCWRDNLLFYEYFHGDNGAGLGVSHQTGWTGLVADMMRRHGTYPKTSELFGDWSRVRRSDEREDITGAGRPARRDLWS